MGGETFGVDSMVNRHFQDTVGRRTNNAIRALRNDISYDVHRCRVENNVVGNTAVHVAHEANGTDPFIQIAHDWILQEGMGCFSELVLGKSSIGRETIQDDDLRARWQEYHRQKAGMCIEHATVNLKGSHFAKKKYRKNIKYPY